MKLIWWTLVFQIFELEINRSIVSIESIAGHGGLYQIQSIDRSIGQKKITSVEKGRLSSSTWPPAALSSRSRIHERTHLAVRHLYVCKWMVCTFLISRRHRSELENYHHHSDTHTRVCVFLGFGQAPTQKAAADLQTTGKFRRIVHLTLCFPSFHHCCFSYSTPTRADLFLLVIRVILWIHIKCKLYMFAVVCVCVCNHLKVVFDWFLILRSARLEAVCCWCRHTLRTVLLANDRLELRQSISKVRAHWLKYFLDRFRPESDPSHHPIHTHGWSHQQRWFRCDWLIDWLKSWSLLDFNVQFLVCVCQWLDFLLQSFR